eukprot:TRINITY_DN49812_c0_g1_i1.p1 TRINITY_DN49812_c0_g1~~TRINITY_DN49812_c0_g1_i1.p1  ORF type:complete len:197 (-),score=9.32 TRINITY_DN49812_c0_g1_i1:317-907(-)
MMSLRLGFERALARRPICVKAALGCGLGFFGDAIAQMKEHQSCGRDMLYDSRRGVAYTSVATIWSGPALHHLFRFYERAFPQGLGWYSVAPKVLMSQLFVNPCVFLPFFYGWSGFVLGRTLDHTIAKVRLEFWDTLTATWMVFTPLNILNFAFVLPQHQVILNTVIYFVYNVILSLITNQYSRAGCLHTEEDATAA